MTQFELHKHLKDIGLPVSYNHFTENQTPPYITYLFSYSTDLKADNHNYYSVDNFQIELYTDKKDLESEKLVEDKLKEIELPYTKLETYIDTEQLFQILYEVQI